MAYYELVRRAQINADFDRRSKALLDVGLGSTVATFPPPRFAFANKSFDRLAPVRHDRHGTGEAKSTKSNNAGSKASKRNIFIKIKIKSGYVFVELSKFDVLFSFTWG
jgi:hypothetical protein